LAKLDKLAARAEMVDGPSEPFRRKRMTKKTIIKRNNHNKCLKSFTLQYHGMLNGMAFAVLWPVLPDKGFKFQISDLGAPLRPIPSH